MIAILDKIIWWVGLVTVVTTMGAIVVALLFGFGDGDDYGD